MKHTWDFSELYKFAEELNDTKNFEKYAKRAVREVAKELVEVIKSFTPVETSKLVHGWDKRKILVNRVGDGFEVLLVNDVPYAEWVNYGHMSYNQHGGPYEIKNRTNRLNNTTDPIPPQKPNNMYVYGWFFVERGIAHYNKYGDLEKVIMENLEKWWDQLG